MDNPLIMLYRTGTTELVSSAHSYSKCKYVESNYKKQQISIILKNFKKKVMD